MSYLELKRSYASLSHNHDSSYSDILHNHDTDYSGLVHTHLEVDITDLQSYSLSTHNHDLTYSLLAHNHSGVYEPVFSKNTGFNLNLGSIVGTVSEGNHNHSGVYANLSHTHLEADITDLQSYSLTTHNHDATYSLLAHNHSGVYEPAFSKNTGFNLNLGSIAGTVSEGSHSHGSGALSNLQDVVITSIIAGEILVWDGTDWLNNTLSEAGISATHTHPYASSSHTHLIADITDFVDNSINWNTAYGWGDHSGLYSLTAHTHVVANISDLDWTDVATGNDFDYHQTSLSAGYNISGGGNITVDGSFRVGWSARFIVIGHGRGAHFSSSGYFDINQPISGSIIAVGGATAGTWNSSGIVLASWEQLYYILPPKNSSNASLSANFRKTRYTSNFVKPDNWIFLAGYNGDNGTVRFGVGIMLNNNETWVSGTTSLVAPTPDTANYTLSSSNLSSGNGATVRTYYGNNGYRGSGVYYPPSDSDAYGQWVFQIPANWTGTSIVVWFDSTTAWSSLLTRYLKYYISSGQGTELASWNVANGVAFSYTHSSFDRHKTVQYSPSMSNLGAGDIVDVHIRCYNTSNTYHWIIRSVWLVLS